MPSGSIMGTTVLESIVTYKLGYYSIDDVVFLHIRASCILGKKHIYNTWIFISTLQKTSNQITVKTYFITH